ncbi:hypothetical protein [Amycolatopsis sp. NPDC054798]
MARDVNRGCTRRNVADARTVAAAFGYFRPEPQQKRQRVGVCSGAILASVDARIRDAVHAAADALERVGHELVETDIRLREEATAAYFTAWVANVAQLPVPV